jgi:TerC family integral membrane protein
MNCTSAESRALFDEIDSDRAGVLEPPSLKRRIRASGAISGMYSRGLSNVAVTLVPTALVALGLFYFKGKDSALDFVAGYVVEDSLSVDNLFVFLVLFKYFKVPPTLQKLCLDLGIFGAVVLRAVFIFGGLALIQAFRPFLLVFSGFLIYSSYTALTSGDDDDDEEEKPPDIVQNLLSYLPTTPKFDGDKLIVPGPNGGYLATPLAVCIIAVELSDILFAVDSVPAIFGITEDPIVVYSSNIAAIVGLRSLYDVLAVAVSDLVYLDKAVAVVLGFVGVKLGLEVAGLELDSMTSLSVIVAILGAGIAASLAQRDQGDKD